MYVRNTGAPRRDRRELDGTSNVTITCRRAISKETVYGECVLNYKEDYMTRSRDKLAKHALGLKLRHN